jgi:hypothetical protein
MPKKLLLILAALGLAASPALGAGSRRIDASHRYSPALDGAPVTVTETRTGTTWSAWAYRQSGEYAIALSTLDERGRWSEPLLIGADDRLDQIDPALVADEAGNLYLAYAVRENGTIHVSALRAGNADWFDPQQVTAGDEHASSPALRVVGDRLVLAYRAEGVGIAMRDWPLLPSTVNGGGIQEGPDGFPLPARQDPPDGGDSPGTLRPGGNSSSGNTGNHSRP